jgi:hypothetical protein
MGKNPKNGSIAWRLSHGAVVERHGAKGHGAMLLYNGAVACGTVIWHVDATEITKKIVQRQKPQHGAMPLGVVLLYNDVVAFDAVLWVHF